MNVLIIASGSGLDDFKPVVKNQVDSLKKHQKNLIIHQFLINEKGFRGYFKSIFILRKLLAIKRFDVIHAHYSLSGFVATLAGAKSIIVSLMGSDVMASVIQRILIKLCSVFFWKEVIVKSEEMKLKLNLNNCFVIPNGVDIDHFKALDKKKCLHELNWSDNKIHILFPADIKRPEKNFILAQQVCSFDKNIEIHWLDNVSYEKMPIYYNAADVILFTSLWEGSPNVIKEALACCRPIVSTDVGDVKWLLNNVSGCYLAGFNSDDLKQKLKSAINYSKLYKTTNGSEKIIELQIDSRSISNRLMKLYCK